MPKQDNGATKPFSLRLTKEERDALEHRAGRMPLGTYIRSRLFGENAYPRRTRGRFPVQDQRSLGQLLALLGRSQIAASLRHLAEAVRIGALAVSPETETAIQEAARDIASMKRHLMAALGIKDG